MDGHLMTLGVSQERRRGSIQIQVLIQNQIAVTCGGPCAVVENEPVFRSNSFWFREQYLSILLITSMTNNEKENRIDYVEFPAPSAAALKANKVFYGEVFGWSFKDWADNYVDTNSSGIASGINSDPSCTARRNVRLGPGGN